MGHLYNVTRLEKDFVSPQEPELPAVILLHYIIHQPFCSKLPEEMKATMDTAIKIVNYICSAHTLKNRLFRILLQDQEALYLDQVQSKFTHDTSMAHFILGLSVYACDKSNYLNSLNLQLQPEI